MFDERGAFGREMFQALSNSALAPCLLVGSKSNHGAAGRDRAVDRTHPNMATGSESFRRSPSHGDAPRHDEEALARSVADAGSHAFGCLFVETWVRADDGTLRLSRPPGGRWMNPAFASSLPSEYLVRRARELDGEAEECPPGEGVAGR